MHDENVCEVPQDILNESFPAVLYNEVAENMDAE
jgi:hypothetical protein